MKIFPILLVFLVASVVTAERHITEHKIMLQGNKTFLEDLEGLGKMSTVDGQCTLTEVELEFVHVKRFTLANFLTNCTNLTTLKLTNVELEWKTEQNFQNIYLPNLEDFEFKQIDDTQYVGSVRETLESVIFFYTNSSKGTGVIRVLQNLNYYYIDFSTPQEASLELSNTKLEAVDVKDEESWRLLYSLIPNIETFEVSYCTIDVKLLRLTSVKALYLRHNDLIGGTLSQLIKSAVVVESLRIYSKVPEAIDIAILPAESLEDIETGSLSLRYNSAPPHLRQQFTNLQEINVLFGDIDLGLFNLSKEFRDLLLYNSYLWNTKLDDILKNHKLKSLFINCQYLDEECPIVDLGSPGLRSIRTLNLLFVEVSVKTLPVRALSNLTYLAMLMCTTDDTISDNIGNIFRHLWQVMLDMEDVLSQKLVLPFVKQRTPTVVVRMPMYDPGANIKAQFKTVIKTVLKATFPADTFDGGRSIVFYSDGGDGYQFSHVYDDYLLRKEYRIRRHLKLHGFSEEEITPALLSQIYTTYMTFVYCICGIGLLCNCLSFVVLMRKTMRSSTSILLLGLACCDSMYLLTSFVSSEEFSNLFQEYFRRSNLNGYLAYPINKTMYTASVYMTILVTVERYVAITKPLLVSSIFTIRKARRYTLLVFGFATLLNLPRWFEFVKWSYEASSHEWNRSSPPQLHRFPLYQIIYQQLLWYLCIYTVPFLTIVTLNILIIRTVTKAARERRITATTHSTAHDTSLTRMLLTVVFVFILCNSVAAALELNFILKGVEPEVSATIVCLPILINSAVNFILYCILGRKFRTELKLLGKEVETWIRNKCNRRRIRRSNSIELRQHRAT